jgi:hypothetical protein
MTKLTDTQCVLLSAAAKRDSLSVYPLPDTLKPGGGLHKTLTALTTRGLIKERETTDAASVSRSDGDYRYGLYVTPAGLAAMGSDCAGRESAPNSLLITWLVERTQTKWRCCQSNANSSPHDAVRSLSAAA